MGTARPGRFFYRLLGAFLLAGVVPTLIASFALGLASRSVLERSLVERADAAALLAAGSLRASLETWAAAVIELSADPAVVDFLVAEADPLTGDREPGRTADANRRLYAAARPSRASVYLVPARGKALGTEPVPISYADAAYASWGIRGALARAVGQPAPATPGIDANPLTAVTAFGRPHADEAAAVSLAIGRAVPALPRPEGPAGYLIIDLKRQAFAELLPGAKEAFTELEILDASGCILYDLNRPHREGEFDEEAAAIDGARIDRDLGRILAGAAVGGGLRLAAYQPITPLEAQLAGLRAVSLLAGIFSAGAALVLSVLLSRSISAPVHRLVQVMGQVEGGDLGARLPVRRQDELGALVRSFNRMVARVERLVDETIEQHRLLRTAETRALQARIDPHFLYNTLNSIKSIARLRGVEEIAVIVTRLGRLLRAGFAVEGEFSSLEEDLELARSYLEIQAIRYPGRFSFELEAESAVLAVPVPRLAIQPIVENSVVHGLEKRVAPGRLWVRARRAGDDVIVEVEDDGVGIDDDRLEKLQAALRAAEAYAPTVAAAGSPAAGPAAAASAAASKPVDAASAGIALANTHRRLRLLFGRRYGLAIEGREGGGVRTTIRVPFRSEGGSPC